MSSTLPTTFSQAQEEQLTQPLDIHLIRHRKGPGGKSLRYITGKTAIETANLIFGFGAWGYKVVSRSHEVVTDARKGQVEFYTVDIELYVVGAAYPIPGDGVGLVTEPFTVEMHEKARKEATTDALKRALRHYGDQFGLCLYDEDDYVDAGNGMLVPVKEVTAASSACMTSPSQPRRIVEAHPHAPVPTTTPPTISTHLDLEIVKGRLNAAFYAGKSQHLFHHKRGMAEYVSGVLGRTVAMEDLVGLSDEELTQVEQALAPEGVAQCQSA